MGKKGDGENGPANALKQCREKETGDARLTMDGTQLACGGWWRQRIAGDYGRQHGRTPSGRGSHSQVGLVPFFILLDFKMT
jgi:hypothetical protein